MIHSSQHGRVQPKVQDFLRPMTKVYPGNPNSSPLKFQHVAGIRRRDGFTSALLLSNGGCSPTQNLTFNRYASAVDSLFCQLAIVVGYGLAIASFFGVQ